MIRLKWFTLLILCVLSASSVSAGSRAGVSLPEEQTAQAPIHSAQPLTYEKTGANDVAGTTTPTNPLIFGATLQKEPAFSQFKRTESQFIFIWVAEVLIFCAILVAFSTRRRGR